MQKFCRAIFPLNSLKNQQQIHNAEILHFNFETYKIWTQKFCKAIFPLNSLKNQQQMCDKEILHFKFETYKIWMQKFCRAIFPLNSLKNQQQIYNAEILHFNFENQELCRDIFRLNSLFKSTTNGQCRNWRLIKSGCKKLWFKCWYLVVIVPLQLSVSYRQHFYQTRWITTLPVFHM